jgi:DNA-binding MarR family transcriptional regulator
MLNKALLHQTLRYLSQVFGEGAVLAGPGAKTSRLPYFLQDTYEVWSGELLGYPVTLACVKVHQPLAFKHLVQHAKQLRELLHAPVIIALPDITAGERKQLIAQGLAFVVPGRQLFAPQLGMILSERFGAEPRREQALASPATQALLIWFLNHPPVTEVWHPFEDAATLGYAGMTATRAIRELLQFNLFELEVRGRAKYLKLTGTRRELWERAKPHLRSPVLRTLWTYDRRILDVTGTRCAGESALAQLTMVNEPQQQVVALTGEAAQQVKQAGIFFELREIAEGIAVQVWSYKPSMQTQVKTVDPLSLWLSLRDNRDDRVQLALEELEEKFLW